MVTTVAIPKERLRPAEGADIKDEPARLVRGRTTVDLSRQFIDDPDADELLNFGAGPNTAQPLPPEKVDELVKAGIGTSGIFTVVEPADLELYRSYMYEPLSMPEKPEVAVLLVDYNHTGNPVTRYQEGFVSVKAMCPDGKESWLVVSMPVSNLLTCYIGVAWGLPKYVADEMSLTPTRAEVKYEGELRLSLELTPGPVDETDDALRGRIAIAMGNALTFHPSRGGTCLIRWFGRGRGGARVAEWQTGTVRVYARPEDPWAGLIPANAATSGFFQRITATGGGDLVFQKVKG